MDEENVNVLCRICISSNSNSNQQMIPIFGENALWQKITTLADVKIEPDDTLPQQVCVACANSAISACVFKKKCEDADSFFRQQLLMQKVENGITISDEKVDDQTIVSSNGNSISANEEENDKNKRANSVASSLTKENNNDEIVIENNKQTDDHENDADNDDDDDDDDDSSDDSSDSSDSDDDSNDSDSEHVDEEKRLSASADASPNDQHEEHQRQILAAGMSSLMAAGYGIAEDGEIKCPNGIKAPFDFNSIRLMHEYMQQQLSKINGNHMDAGNNGNIGSDNEHNEADGSESANGAGAANSTADDEEALPLIPEIELITPPEEAVAALAAAAAANGGMTATAAEAYNVASMAQMRGYQCPSCFQIFEMKQILKAHMQSVHGTAGPVYECTNCKKTYFYKRFLEKHVRRGRCVKKRRNQTRPMQCTDCDVLFPTGHHLGWHKRTGCPSRAAKLPLQQLFKQNVAQYNTLPKRIGLRKPENAIYLHNRKLMMASNKRKGRTRIKLDAKKIALAKQLILREATTTVIANELNISRTFAWRLRKSLVNGVSLHERVIEQNTDEQSNTNEQLQQQQQHILQQQQQQQFMLQHQIQQQQQLQLEAGEFPHIKMTQIKPEKTESDDDDDNNQHVDDESRLNNKTNSRNKNLDESAPHGPLPLLVNNEQIPITNNSRHADEDRLKENISKEGKNLENNRNNVDSLTDTETKEPLKRQKNSAGGINLYSLHHSQEQFLKNMVAHAQRENVIVANGGVDFHKHANAVAKNGGGLPSLPLLNFPPAVAAAINHLPVNLSIRPIASMQKMETSNYKKLNNSNNMIPSTSSSPGASPMPSMSGGVKKPRKPNVFIDDEKYAMAKILVAQNASTMEIARALNVSQMTAWKVRDAIVKGLPLSYRNKREREMQHNAAAMLYNRHEDVGSSGGSDGGGSSDSKLLLQQQQQQQHQHLQQHEELQRQKQQQQQQQQLQQQHLKLVQRQQQQQRLLYQEQQQQQRILQQEQQKQQQKLQEQQKHLNKPLISTAAAAAAAVAASLTATNEQHHDLSINSGGQKRRRLKAAEREMRDKEITREILELIKEDSNIQYWKVSARLAEKGYPISPSSVCQKLKSMGIHRRWKFADKPKPLNMDVEHLKVAAVAAAAAAAAGIPNSMTDATGNGAGVMSDEAAAVAAAAVAANFEPSQFHMGGAHFLSAFTR